LPTVSELLAAYLGNPQIAAQIPNQPYYNPANFDSPHDYFCTVAIDALFFCPYRRTARALSDQSDQVYAYYMTFIYKYIQQNFPSLGAFHGEELPFVFADPHPPPLNGIQLQITHHEFEFMTGLFQNYWNNFVLTGNPVRITANDPEWCPFWPQYDTTHGRSNAEKILNITLNYPAAFTGEIVSYPCEFWDSVQPLLNVQNPNPTPAPTHRPHHTKYPATRRPVDFEEQEFLGNYKRKAPVSKKN